MALLPPFFLDSVVALGIRPKAGSPAQWSASGFLYGQFVKQEGDQKGYRLYLVTNRHVFESAGAIVLRFNAQGDAPAREFDESLHLGDGSPKWLAPNDPEVDVAVLPVSARAIEAAGIQFSYFRSDQHVLLRFDAIEAGLSEGDGAYVLGFPIGLVGGNRNYVILRSGSVARVRDWLTGSSNHILIDATVLPGNSGGPVVSRPEFVAIEGTKAQLSAKLLGVVKGYLPYTDVAVSQQTQRPRVTFEENSGLAIVVPIDFVDETIRAHLESGQPVETAEANAVSAEEPSATQDEMARPRADTRSSPIEPRKKARSPAKTTRPRKG
jgi:S1-C subfamily serine protease